jgi:hypothetical protein
MYFVFKDQPSPLGTVQSTRSGHRSPSPQPGNDSLGEGQRRRGCTVLPRRDQIRVWNYLTRNSSGSFAIFAARPPRLGLRMVMRTPAQLEKWRAIRRHRIEHLLRIRCPFCGAPAGEPCRTKAGREILSTGEMYDARITPTRAHKRYRRYR